MHGNNIYYGAIFLKDNKETVHQNFKNTCLREWGFSQFEDFSNVLNCHNAPPSNVYTFCYTNDNWYVFSHKSFVSKLTYFR